MRYKALQNNVHLSTSLAVLSDFAERLYWRMLARADSWGRLPGEPMKILAECVPLLGVSDATVSAALVELERAGRVARYRAPDASQRPVRVCQIVDFDANQPGEFLRRRGVSVFPSAPELPDDSGSSPDDSGSDKKPLENSTSPGVVPSSPGAEVEVAAAGKASSPSTEAREHDQVESDPAAAEPLESPREARVLEVVNGLPDNKGTFGRAYPLAMQITSDEFEAVVKKLGERCKGGTVGNPTGLFMRFLNDAALERRRRTVTQPEAPELSGTEKIKRTDPERYLRQLGDRLSDVDREAYLERYVPDELERQRLRNVVAA